MLAAVELVEAHKLASVLADQEGGVGPVANELVIPQLLLEDDVEPCEGDCAVSAGIGLQPDVCSCGAVDTGGVDVDVLGGVVLVDFDAAAHGAPQRTLGSVGFRPALAPVDDCAGIRGGDGHDCLDGPTNHSHVQGVVPAPADSARVNNVAGVAKEIEEARACPQVIGAVRALGGEQGLGAVLLLKCHELGGNLVNRLFPGDLFPLVLALLANALHAVVDALGMVVELDCFFALATEAVAENGALLFVRAHLYQAAGLGVDTAPDTAVHVAHEATGPAPADAVLIDRVVGDAQHGNLLAHCEFLSPRLLFTMSGPSPRLSDALHIELIDSL